MNPNARYWERGLNSVPSVTGAASLLDAQDLPQLAKELGFLLPLKAVLDVGCGTGRIARHCDGYIGVDISRDAVDYCSQAGLQAMVIDGPDDLMGTGFGHPEWVVCMSVFTHIDEPERVAYLEHFHKMAPKLLVDIIPGDGRGDVAMWTADPVRFEELLLGVGYDIVNETERKAPSGDFRHRYYYARAL